tara:strand:- start:96 stop:653 length:558 start_codon:yes stop_codon:yes gene_type:complete
MKQSDTIANLAAAMAAAQSEMGAAIKGSTNPFLKNKYADLGSVIDAVKAPFAAHGLSYVQFPVSGENAVGVATRLMHSSGEWLEQEYFIPLGKMDAQAAGSAITYARRYALQSIAGIPAEEDDGHAAAQSAPKVITAAQAKIISALIAKTSSDLPKFCEVFECESIAALPAPQFARAKAMLESKL